MSTQPYQTPPLFTPGVVLGIIVFLLTCWGLFFGDYYTKEIRADNELRARNIATKMTERNKIENDGLVQAYRLFTQNKGLIQKQKKFSDIPHLFSTLVQLQENTNTKMEWFAYQTPILHTTVLVPFPLTAPRATLSANKRAVQTAYDFLALFRDGVYNPGFSYPSAERINTSPQDNDDTYEAELRVDSFIDTYTGVDAKTPVYFTLDFVPSISLRNDSENTGKSFQFGVDFRLKDIID